MTVSSSDLLFVAQWTSLRTWAGTLGDDLSTPSSLDGWTVEHLLAHLVRVADSVAALRPAPPGIMPVTVSRYLTAYADSAGSTAETARQIAEEISGHVLEAMDSAYAQAGRTLAALGAVDLVVTARRGPILLFDFLDTRLIELVVHAGDLARSLPHHPPPRVLGSARARVTTVLRAVVLERAPDAGAATAGLPDEEFLDYATGRVKVPYELAEQTGGALPLL